MLVKIAPISKFKTSEKLMREGIYTDLITPHEGDVTTIETPLRSLIPHMSENKKTLTKQKTN